MGFEFRVLGSVEVVRDGRMLPIRSAKQRVVLTCLLLDANRVVPVEKLVNQVWDVDRPDGAHNALQIHIARLRLALGTSKGGPIVTRPRGYLIDVADDAVDLHRFDALVRQAGVAAGSSETEQARLLLREALGLWRDQPLLDAPSHYLQREVVPALTERRLDAVELLVDVDLALGRHHDVLPELRQLTTAHPLRERFWAQRILALYRSGRQAEALDCYRTVNKLIVEELGVDPGPDLQQLHQQILNAHPALAAATAHRRVTGATGNRPTEITTFVGRERQLAEAQQTLQNARLVTLTGTGGVGKTRLALQLATQVSGTFRDGVWLADLATLSDPELLDRTVAEALGIHDQSARPGVEVLVEHLRMRQLLLVLDNCEHLVDSLAPLVLRLLRAAPDLRVLATSRQRLGLQGEHVMLVPPLSVPDDTEHPQLPLNHYEAVELLAERTAASAPGFQITDANRTAVARLCQRLDGIPLAIELAAARLSTISIEEILQRLDDRFRLLTGGGAPTSPPYHQTLRRVVDWSYLLCSEPEQRLWARLSVFSGGFDLGAAEAVCAGEDIARQDVLDLLTSLVHKSILAADNHGDRTRYRLLETIRQYGQQRLHDLGEDTARRRRHRDYYQNVAARAAADWCGPGEVTWMAQLRQELPNLRTALDFCVTEPGEGPAGLDISVNLTRARCWFFSSTLGEGRHWLSRTDALHPKTPVPLRASGVALAAWIALWQGDQEIAGALLTDCRDLARRSGEDNPVPALAFVEGSHALLVRGDSQAIPLLAHARKEFHRGGAVGDAHMATLFWALASAFLGGRDAAVAASAHCLADAEAHKAAWASSWALWTVGLTELRHGDPHRAVALFRDALRRQRDIGDDWGPGWGVEALAWTAAATGHHHRAAQLLGAANRVRQLTGVTISGLRPFHDAHTQTYRLTRQALGVNAYTAAFEHGNALDPENGIQLALHDPQQQTG